MRWWGWVALLAVVVTWIDTKFGTQPNANNEYDWMTFAVGSLFIWMLWWSAWHR